MLCYIDGVIILPNSSETSIERVETVLKMSKHSGVTPKLKIPSFSDNIDFQERSITPGKFHVVNKTKRTTKALKYHINMTALISSLASLIYTEE